MNSCYFVRIDAFKSNLFGSRFIRTVVPSSSFTISKNEEVFSKLFGEGIVSTCVSYNLYARTILLSILSATLKVKTFYKMSVCLSSRSVRVIVITTFIGILLVTQVLALSLIDVIILSVSKVFQNFF